MFQVDLGDDAARDGIVRFMPYAFKTVNEVCQSTSNPDDSYTSEHFCVNLTALTGFV